MKETKMKTKRKETKKKEGLIFEFFFRFSLWFWGFVNYF